jgi:hypothetical protein
MPQMTIDNIRNTLSGIQLTERSVKDDYYGRFHSHLYSMFQFSLLSETARPQSNVFDSDRYHGLEQYILDHTNLVEKDEPAFIDANLLDDARDVLKKHIKSMLGKEGNSDMLKPIINFTADAYENHLMYNMMHNNSQHNPWNATYDILRRGYIYLVSDSRDLIEEFKPKIIGETKEISENIGFITKVHKEKEFKGLILDNRLSTQSIVYSYLKSHGTGVGMAKSKDKIRDFLASNKRNISNQYLLNWILLPLKRAGLIGSCQSGYYFINSEADFKNSYRFQKSKIDAMQRTLDILNIRAIEKGFIIV